MLYKLTFSTTFSYTYNPRITLIVRDVRKNVSVPMNSAYNRASVIAYALTLVK